MGIQIARGYGRWLKQPKRPLTKKQEAERVAKNAKAREKREAEKARKEARRVWYEAQWSSPPVPARTRKG